MISSGIYIAVFYLSSQRRITIGRLGCFKFEKGIYVYVGSAQRNLQPRIQRHAIHRKALRWHIDYLSAKTTMLGALTLRGDKVLECKPQRCRNQPV